MTSMWVIRILLTTFFITIAAVFVDWIVTRLFPRKNISRRWIWVGAMGASVMLPLVSLWVTWGHPLLTMILQRWSFTVHTTAIGAFNIHPHGNGDGLEVVTGTWGILSPTWDRRVLLACAVLSALGLLFFIGVHFWIHIRRAGWVRSQVDGVDVLITPSIGPAVVGIYNPIILLPAWVLGAPFDTRRAILQHEEAHIAAGDSRLLVVSAFLLALMPWNLALWWQYRWLHAAIETDCDARVLATGVDVREYGEMLLGVASRTTMVPILSPAFCANSSLIERRIVAMTRLSGRCSRVLVAVYAGVALIALTAAVDASSRSMPPMQTRMKVTLKDPLRIDAEAFVKGRFVVEPARVRAAVEMTLGGKAQAPAQTSRAATAVDQRQAAGIPSGELAFLKDTITLAPLSIQLSFPTR